MPLIAKCFARLWLNSETFFAKFNHFKLAHILHSRRTLQARFFNGQMPTGNKTWKMWAVTLCLSCPHPEYVCSINDCQTLHWTTKNCRGGGAASRGRPGAVTDGRASLLFLKLGEFFPGSVIRILMVLVSRDGATSTEPPAIRSNMNCRGLPNITLQQNIQQFSDQIQEEFPGNKTSQFYQYIQIKRSATSSSFITITYSLY